jgi:NADPH-dependent ferric siderophore reductase
MSYDLRMAAQGSTRIRREPPPFRVLEVRALERLSPFMTRVTLGGPALDGFVVELPAASVRLLIPSPGSDELIMPAWNGNEFLLADGTRPIIRTFTPRLFDADRLELALDVVIHDGGVVSAWINGAKPGDPAAVSGPGRGYAIDPDVPQFLLAGDETAIPAICQLLEHLPAPVPVEVIIEVTEPQARQHLQVGASVNIRWVDLPAGAVPGDALVSAVGEVELASGAKVWVAGEAAAMHRIRRHCFEERGLARADVTVRGYWKAER